LKHLKWKSEIVHFEKTFGTLLKRLNVHLLYDLGASQVGLVIKNLPANEGDIRDSGLISRSGRSLGEGNSNPLQYYCLDNLTDRGAWQATVCGITKSWTQLNDYQQQQNCWFTMLY
ncbi:hypothetical protein ABN226_18705, partial [Morganella morganii]|uniref:hypothetical protein n=1 Tax=Morganella morganii TaxID=582 RepID=UPI0032DAEBB8